MNVVLFTLLPERQRTLLPERQRGVCRILENPMKYEIVDSQTHEPVGAAFQTEGEAADYVRLAKGLGYAYQASRERLTNDEAYNAGMLIQCLGVDGY